MRNHPVVTRLTGNRLIHLDVIHLVGIRQFVIHRAGSRLNHWVANRREKILPNHATVFDSSTGCGQRTNHRKKGHRHGCLRRRRD